MLVCRPPAVLQVGQKELDALELDRAELAPPPQVGQYAELELPVLPLRTALLEPKAALRCACAPDEIIAPWEVRKLLADDSSEEIALIVAFYFLLTNLKTCIENGLAFRLQLVWDINAVKQMKEVNFWKKVTVV